jgi:UDP-N-acetylmuramate--alanine ligase
MFEKKHRVHFVGIGGIGMSGIAEVLLNLGYSVSGSSSSASESARSLGAEIFLGHREWNRCRAVGRDSTAVKFSNPKLSRRGGKISR